ncbi:uncharacterized protein PITG_19275 [Phytophthora infestans T30-4]|uniref:Uncharacterized protein n=1 Tax=Phytophthora infestans (strain T30-4) TaxID=403677 RepID=D0NZK9_PHYIT|nr:uncharacterized protein PITG_19275 [Phytophthora infestans T30-4]EEY69568.1 hypothetical protein PITG_19275 [Phytophthora infestans T30-4]|eukprot:XP_002997206.1 hypothetical protein PITG_19275 [Phytophthora infestans T30-4]
MINAPDMSQSTECNQHAGAPPSQQRKSWRSWMHGNRVVISLPVKAFYSSLDEYAHQQRRKLIYQGRQKRNDIELTSGIPK